MKFRYFNPSILMVCSAQIGNRSIEWLESLESVDEPFLMWIGPHAPHEPATPAPWYARHPFNASIDTAPRPISYNAVCTAIIMRVCGSVMD